MPRPAQYERSEALTQAMETFWRKGFKATSMKDLTQATGLQPGSLYGAFDSKRSLFLEALETYFELHQAGLDDLLTIDASPVQRIRGVFERIIESNRKDPDNKGCMMANTLLETPVSDDEINRRLREMFGLVEDKLESVIREAQEAGEIDQDRDSKALAQTLLMALNGMRMICKTRPDPALLYRSVDNFMSMLG